MAMPRERRCRVFVSYSRHDEHLVKPLAALLGAAADDSVFLDVESLKPGSMWETEIMGAVRASKIFVVCWCCRGSRSDFMAREIETALEDSQKRIVPVLLCSFGLTDHLADRQWIDLRGRIYHDCGEGEEPETRDQPAPKLSVDKTIPTERERIYYSKESIDETLPKESSAGLAAPRPTTGRLFAALVSLLLLAGAIAIRVLESTTAIRVFDSTTGIVFYGLLVLAGVTAGIAAMLGRGGVAAPKLKTIPPDRKAEMSESQAELNELSNTVAAYFESLRKDGKK